MLALLLAALPAVHGPEAAAAEVRALLPDATARVERRLGPVAWEKLEVLLATSAETRGAVPDWAAGFASPGRGLAVIRTDRLGSYPVPRLEQVLVHELAHLAIARRLGNADAPRWLEEGCAMSVARESGPADAYRVSLALLIGPEVGLDSLDERFLAGPDDAETAYAVSLAFVTWLEDRAGDDACGRLIDALAAGASTDDALGRVGGAPAAELERIWRRHLFLYYRTIPILTSTATLWLAITLLALLAWRRRRRRDRALEARWEVEDAEEGPFGPN